MPSDLPPPFRKPSSQPPRWSSQTIDTRRAVAVSRLLAAWEKSPSLRLGELLVTAIRSKRIDVAATLERIENDDLLEAIERLVLLGESPGE